MHLSGGRWKDEVKDMTGSEFRSWLDGYMIERPNPNAALIAAKAREIVEPAPYYPQIDFPSSPEPFWVPMRTPIRTGDTGTINTDPPLDGTTVADVPEWHAPTILFTT